MLPQVFVEGVCSKCPHSLLKRKVRVCQYAHFQSGARPGAHLDNKMKPVEELLKCPIDRVWEVYGSK